MDIVIVKKRAPKSYVLTQKSVTLSRPSINWQDLKNLIRNLL